MNKITLLPTYIINLPERLDRKSHVIDQFSKMSNFCVNIIEACDHKIGSVGLWQSLVKIVNIAQENNYELVLVCEDDHMFSTEYENITLLSAINEANELGADVLLGGISWSSNCIPVSKSLFWVEKFSGLQFTVIFNRFYETILLAEFGEGDAADYKISALSERKYFIFPFISTQKEFGYSDVTLKNNQTNRVEALFKDSLMRVHAVNQVIGHYHAKFRQFLKKRTDTTDYLNYKITTSVVSRSPFPATRS